LPATSFPAMMVSTTDILNLLRAKPGRFVEDIAGDELPMRESDDSYVVVWDNGRDYRVTARVEQIEDPIFASPESSWCDSTLKKPVS
jgi:hypothetical protein